MLLSKSPDPENPNKLELFKTKIGFGIFYQLLLSLKFAPLVATMEIFQNNNKSFPKKKFLQWNQELIIEKEEYHSDEKSWY